MTFEIAETAHVICEGHFRGPRVEPAMPGHSEMVKCRYLRSMAESEIDLQIRRGIFVHADFQKDRIEAGLT